MAAAALLRLIFVTLTLSSLGTHAARRNHPGRFRRAVNPSASSLEYQFPRERLLSGAGCTVPLPPEVRAPRENVWLGLTQKEHNDVSKWLLDQKEFNLTRGYDYYNRRIDTIWDMEIMPPNKTDVLRYLDKNGTAPARYASVTLSIAASKTPFFKNILVGPLPVSNATTWQPLNYPFTRKTPIRSLSGHMDYDEYGKFNQNITNSIKDITEDLWNLTAQKWEAYSGQTPSWQYDGKITEWSQYWAYTTTDFDSGSLLPLGLYYGAEYDLFGSDPSTWKFKGWLYNDIYYPTTEDFRKAYFSPGFQKFGPNVDGSWTSTDQRGPVLPLDTEAPPMPVAKRARFSVDVRRKYVEWMGYSFFIVSKESGLALYDVRFKGERIIYELALQEALGHYAGVDPVQSGTAYLEGLGDSNELFPGYDCPTYATYLNTTYVGGYSDKEVNSICIFEFDADYPIQRHWYDSITKNIYLVVRTVTTVGNYDYMLTYEFYMDGSIQVVVRFAGYIQASYFAKNHEYGYHIHDFLSGGMHDHVLNFKADLDILGTSNTMELVTVTPTTESYVWSDHPRNTMKLSRHEVESENESRLKWSGNGATQYRIINKDKPNKYGEYRGYRILPSQGTVHLAIDNSSNLVNAANWVYDDLAITKQKDTEPQSYHDLNGNDVYDPLVNFDDFFDGDNLEQEDLVLWFNLGVHHIPHTGDLPNTVYSTAHSAIQITPSNYFLFDQSRDTVNQARIDFQPNHTVVKTFGQAHQVCMANLSGIGYGYGYY